MKRFRIETSKIEKAFKGAYQERKKLFSKQAATQTRDDDPWVNQVMYKIRTLESARLSFDISVVFERIFWRFAPAAVVVVCLLSIWLSQVDVAVEYDVASLFMTDPIGFTDMPSF